MFHLRYTPYDISGYTFNFLENYDRYIIAYEDKTKLGQPAQPHYHIYIVTDYGKKSVENAAKSSLQIPKAPGRGKNNAYYSLKSDWKDPGYICKYGDIRGQKGFNPAEILDYVNSGKEKYLQKVEVVELSGKVSPATPRTSKVSFQQAVLADTQADWLNYKRDCRDNEDKEDKSKLIEFICSNMRKNGRGINEYLVKDIYYGVLFDDFDYRDLVLKKIKSGLFL